MKSRAAGNVYYHNETTGESVWEIQEVLKLTVGRGRGKGKGERGREREAFEAARAEEERERKAAGEVAAAEMRMAMGWEEEYDDRTGATYWYNWDTPMWLIETQSSLPVGHTEWCKA